MGKFSGVGKLAKSGGDLEIESTLSEQVSSELGILPQLIPLTKIYRSPFQPRRFFDPQKITKMAEKFRSYRERGVYPKTVILVRPAKSGYELIFGERRKLAAEEAGFTDFLAFVDSSITDDEARELALLENLSQEELNPIEKTEAVLGLAAVRLDTTPEGIKQLLDKAANDRKQNTNNVIRSHEWQELEAFFQELPIQITPDSFRSNYLPLLNLPADVLDVIRQGKLEYTKARAIAGIKDEQQRQQFLKTAIKEELSIREIRDRIREIKNSDLEVTEEIGTENQPNLKQQFTDVTKRLRQSKAWDDPKKAAKIKKLLEQIESLL